MVDDPDIIKLVKKMQKDSQKDVRDVLKDLVLVLNGEEEKEGEGKKEIESDQMPGVSNGNMG